MTSPAIAAPVLKPGIYRDVAFETYVEWDAVNSHLLNGFARTPAHVRYEILHGGMQPTKSTERGWLVHLATLEPKRFSDEVAVAPNVDRRTRRGKDAWTDFTLAHDGKLVVDEDEHRAACKMRDSLLSHPTAGLFLRGRGANELSIVWEEQKAGVLCKARLDRIASINEFPVIGDIKTAKDASKRAFERAMVTYGYGRQASHYLAGLQALVPVPIGNPYRKFVFLVVEAEPPYLTACYEIDDAALEHCEDERQRFLRTWRSCHETGVWPGYPAGIDYVSLPSWVMKSWSSDGGE